MYTLYVYVNVYADVDVAILAQAILAQAHLKGFAFFR